MMTAQVMSARRREQISAMEQIEHAYEVLDRPLVFGDADQLGALTVIAPIEECIIAMRGCSHEKYEQKKDCPECWGHGWVRSNKRRGIGQDCVECDGTGKVTVPCVCVEGFSTAVREQAQLKFALQYEPLLRGAAVNGR
jgi:DnaJ-class molecular chaperone